jgi:hypothetical protein
MVVWQICCDKLEMDWVNQVLYYFCEFLFVYNKFVGLDKISVEEFKDYLEKMR